MIIINSGIILRRRLLGGAANAVHTAKEETQPLLRIVPATPPSSPSMFSTSVLACGYHSPESSLRFFDLSFAPDLLAVVATLSESFDGSDTILKPSSLPLIIKMLQTSSSRAAKEYCVSILLALCNNLGNEVIAILANNTNLISFLYTLSTNGGSQGVKKAQTLIRIMHRFHETNSSSLMANWDLSRIAQVHSC